MSVENDRFPVGLRVLVVDDDPTCLKLMDNLLTKCHYQVTTTNKPEEALRMLKENKNRFDIVITDVEMPGIDGIRLLQLVGLEMNLPVIMLSAYSDTKRVMQGIRNGACDYLVKPVRIQELQNIWQHVVRRNKSIPLHTNADAGGSASAPTANTPQDRTFRGQGIEENSGDDNNDDDDDEMEDVGRENENPATQRKPRLFWSVELHQKFVDAVNQLGIDKAFPKKILDLMDVEGLTREKVASHLQKYRLYLKKVNSGTSQQLGNRLVSVGAEDVHIDPLGGGYGIYRSLAGSGRFPGVTSLPNQGGGMLGRLNTSSGLTLRGLSSSPMLQTPQISSSAIVSTPQLSSPMLQPPQHPNSSNSNTLGKFESMSFPANQNTSLFHGLPTSMQTNKPSIFSPPTPSMMFNGNPLSNTGEFGNQSSLISPSSNLRSLGIRGFSANQNTNLLDPSCKTIWGTPIQPAIQPSYPPQNVLPTNVSSGGFVPVNAQSIQNDSPDMFCRISSMDELQRNVQSQDCPSGLNNFHNLGLPQFWQDQRPDYLLNSCNFSNTSSSLITAGAPTQVDDVKQSNNNMMNISPFSQLEGASSQFPQQNEVQKSNNDSIFKFDENYMLDHDTKLFSGSGQSDAECLEDIVGFLKQGNGESATARGDFGQDRFLM